MAQDGHVETPVMKSRWTSLMFVPGTNFILCFNTIQECQANGEDYEKVKILETQADDAERWDKRKKAKTNPDQGFSDYAAATYRSYQRNTKQLKPNPEEYAQEKLKM